MIRHCLHICGRRLAVNAQRLPHPVGKWRNHLLLYTDTLTAHASPASHNMLSSAQAAYSRVLIRILHVALQMVHVASKQRPSVTFSAKQHPENCSGCAFRQQRAAPYTLDLTSLPTELLRLVEVISAQSEQVDVFEICSQVMSTGKQNLIIVLENVRARIAHVVLRNSTAICISNEIYDTLEYRSRKADQRTLYTPHSSNLNHQESSLHFQRLCHILQLARKANFCLLEPPFRAYSADCSAQSWSRAVCPSELVPILCNDKSHICTKEFSLRPKYDSV